MNVWGAEGREETHAFNSITVQAYTHAIKNVIDIFPWKIL